MFDHVLHALRQSRLKHVDFGHVDQTNSASALFAGHFEGVVTAGVEFGGSRLGLGVMHDLDGEVISIRGKTWAIPPSGVPRRVAPEETIAFGISSHGGLRHRLDIPPDTGSSDLVGIIDRFLIAQRADKDTTVCALEISGTFRDVVLRTVHHPDYEGESLGEIIDDEIRFSFPQWAGTLVGFRYPDHSDGSTIPGLHLHGLGDDERSGGHLRNATIESVSAHIWLDEWDLDTPEDTASDAASIDFDRYEGPVPPSGKR